MVELTNVKVRKIGASGKVSALPTRCLENDAVLAAGDAAAPLSTEPNRVTWRVL
jgi:hypothetical protein